MRKSNNPERQFLLLISFLLVILGTLLGIVAKAGDTHPIDMQITQTIQSNQPSWLLAFNKFVSIFEFGIIVITIPTFFYLKSKRKNYEAYFVLVAGLSWFVMRLLKTIFAIPCPTGVEVQILYTFHNLETQISPHINAIRYIDPNVCYPSGHVFDYITIWGTLFTLRKRITTNKRVQQAIAILSIFLIMFVGESRIALGSHWFSDVLAGYLFGFAWLYILIFLFNKKLYPPIPLNLRNSPTKLMKELGYGKGYDKYTKDDLLPDKLKGKKYFKNQK